MSQPLLLYEVAGKKQEVFQPLATLANFIIFEFVKISCGEDCTNECLSFPIFAQQNFSSSPLCAAERGQG